MPRSDNLETMIGQLIFPRIGSNLAPNITVEEDEERIAELIHSVGIGGLCLFNGRWPSTRDTLQRLQQRSKIPLLVAADIEQGVGQQIHGLAVFPHAMAFDGLGGQADSYLTQFAKVTAQEAQASGIHVALGPVADVHSDPANPIISTRAFGTDPQVVAHRVATYIHTAQTNGLLCTAKHFPGHGDTTEDSHDSQPVVTADWATLSSRELVPFRAAIQVQSALIMTAHVVYPALDAGRNAATVSAPILTQLLRNDLGFRGAVISDSLRMAGIRSSFDSEVELSLAALNAGVDILLDIDEPAATRRGIVEAVRRGRFPLDRIEQAAERVARLKRAAAKFQDDFPCPDLPPADAIDLSHDLAGEIAIEACQRFGPWQPPRCPIATNRSVGVLFVTPMADNAYGLRFVREDALAILLREKCPRVDSVIFGPSVDQLSPLAHVVHADHLILALVVKPAAWQRHCLLPYQIQQVQQLLESRRDLSLTTTVVSLGGPQVLELFPTAERKLCAYSDVPASQRAVARILLAE